MLFTDAFLKAYYDYSSNILVFTDALAHKYTMIVTVKNIFSELVEKYASATGKKMYLCGN